MNTEEAKAGPRDGPEEQHANAESMIKSKDDNSGGVIATTSAQQDESIVAGTGSKLSDIKALMAAKHAIPADDQSDPERMGKHYDAMATKCTTNGLNLGAMKDSNCMGMGPDLNSHLVAASYAGITCSWKWFNTDSSIVTPKEYMKFDLPLAAGAVRLAVLRLTDAESDNLATAVGEATQRVLQAVPQGSVFHCNDVEHYHITVQMISHPSDPRPDTFREGGGLSHSLDHRWIPAPLGSNLKRERDICQTVARESASPELRVHSIILADSGALLLLFTEASGTVKALRQKLSSALPGANEKQPTILHVTIARLLEAELSLEQVSKLAQLCSEETAKLRGKILRPDSLWHVIEKTFTYVNDDANCVRCPFKEQE